MCRFCVNGLPGQDFDMFGGMDSMFVKNKASYLLSGTVDYKEQRVGECVAQAEHLLQLRKLELPPLLA